MANRKKKSPTSKQAISDQTLLPDVSKADAPSEVKVLTYDVMTFIPTSNPDLFRYADENGDWQFYWVKSLDIFVPAVNRILRFGMAKGQGFYNYLLSVDKQTAKETLETAGERGARVHEAIKWLIEGKVVERDTKFKNDLSDKYEPLTNDEWRFLMAFVRWCADYKPEVIANEISVWNKDMGVAGTIDFLGFITIKNKKILVLIDFKTSSAIHDDYKLQVAAYSAMCGQKIKATGILRLKLTKASSKTPYEFKIWDETETTVHLDAFRSAKKIHDLITDAENYNPRDDQEQLPMSLKVIVPKFSKDEKETNPVEQRKKRRDARPVEQRKKAVGNAGE